MGSSRLVLSAVVAAIALSADLGAHRLDELLQAARLDVSPTRTAVTLDLTPGIEVAASVVEAIDRDKDARHSPDEAAAFARLVQSALALDVDGRPSPLIARLWTVPEAEALTGGTGIIRIELAAEYDVLPHGAHVVTFRNQFRPEMGLYLANALVPSDRRVAVHGQERDATQSELRISVAVGDEPTSSLLVLLPILTGLFVIAVMVWIRKSIG